MASILHTADWHLGKIFANSNFSLLPIQEALLEEIIDLAEKEDVDLILIAGDVFDSYNPPFKAEELLYRTLVRLTGGGRRPVLVCAGNHDAPEKFEVPRPLAAGVHGIVLIGGLPVNLSDFSLETPYYSLEGRGNFLKLKLKTKNEILALKVLPYPSETRFGMSGEKFRQKLWDLLQESPDFTADKAILLSHLWTEEAQSTGSERSFLGGIELVPLHFFSDDWDYIALGHLHRFQQVAPKICYPGSLFPFTLEEAEDPKGVVLWNANKGLQFKPLSAGPPIRKISCQDLEEALTQAEQDKDSLVFLKFPALNLGPEGIRRLKAAYGARLLGLHFDLPEEIISEPPSIERLEPEELFREFYRHHYRENPSEDLVRLFCKFLREVQEP